MILQGDNFREDKQSWKSVLTFMHEKELIEQGMNTFWMIWKNRNSCVHNMMCKNPFTLKQVTEIMTRESMASRNLSSGAE